MSQTLPLWIVLLVGLLQTTHAGYFWHLTDFHVDPYYEDWGPGLKNSCNRDISENQGPLGDYECDPPYALLHSAMRAINQHGADPAFIMWTGDNTPHPRNISWLKTNETIDILRNCTNIIKQGLGDKDYPVIVSLGNHDYYPKNQLPPEKNPVYDAVYDMWKPWLENDDMKETFTKGAYYTRVIPGKSKLRILMVNTNLYSDDNDVVKGVEDPGGQFAWMRSVLDNARTEGEKVHLVTHIPPGVLEVDGSARWFAEGFNEKFSDLVSDYGDVIVGSYSAHQHLDTFRIFYKNEKPVVGMLVTPSVTPWRARVGPSYVANAHNPAIRKIMFDEDTYELTDVVQYYLDLPQADDVDAEWQELYKYSELYGVSKVDAQSLHNLVVEHFKENNSSKFYNYNVMNTVNAIHASNKGCDCECQHEHVCAIVNVHYEKFDRCLEDKEEQCASGGSSRVKVGQGLWLVILNLVLLGMVLCNR